MEVVHAQERRKPADFHARSRAVAISPGETHIEEAMMSNARTAARAAAKSLDFQVMSGSFSLAGNQPANYTLVKGETEALLIDVPFSRSDAHRVVAAILDSGKKLTTIFVTHDHPDHFFSLDLLTDSFPNARIVAHAVVAKDMERSIPLKFQRWAEGIGANAPRRGVVPTALQADEITLEGHTLKILGPMQGDHVHCTALWDPGTRTLVAGDLVYNGAFVFLGEHLAPQYVEWLASLDYLESLKPIRIIAGHTKPGLPDDSFAIDWTRGYIRAFANAAKIAKSSREMAAMIHALYPNAVNFPGTEFLVEVPTQVATGEIPPWNE
jgi:glyoxylase-like metal-dependent hydrolase (beta-lactamase superfamily II)